MFDQEALDELKPGAYKVTITKIRNYKFHQKFFVLLNYGLHNQSKDRTMDEFLKTIKKKLKLYVIVGEVSLSNVALSLQLFGGHDFIEEDGHIYAVKLKSISFGSMDDIEFEQLYSDTIDVLIKMIPNSTKEDMDRIALEYINFT